MSANEQQPSRREEPEQDHLHHSSDWTAQRRVADRLVNRSAPGRHRENTVREDRIVAEFTGEPYMAPYPVDEDNADDEADHGVAPPAKRTEVIGGRRCIFPS